VDIKDHFVFLRMMDVNVIKDDRQMRSLTGLDQEEFCWLSTHFAQGYQQLLEKGFDPVNRPRQRKAGAGRKGVLTSTEDKLFFILYYLKVYPTFDVLATNFGFARSKACENAHKLAQALELTLQQLGVLPVRQIGSLEAMQQVFKDLRTILIDASERPYLRSANALEQAANYSGKKKTYP
jgi:hypothetical protein